MDVYVISDLHLSHENMAKHRGFIDSNEMNNHIINKWNSVVKKNDTVWILGDISMEKSAPYKILNLLNGIKKVVLGNHDLPQHVPELLKYVNFVCGSFKIKGVILTHIPINENELNRFNKNIHGHLHMNSLDDPRYVNVSSEILNYTPIKLNDII